MMFGLNKKESVWFESLDDDGVVIANRKCEEEAKATKGRVFWEEVVLNTVKSIRIPECVREFCQVTKTVPLSTSP